MERPAQGHKSQEAEYDLFGEPIINDPILRDRFIEPPFSVLDTKSGHWQNRKRQWKTLGIESHLGREGVVTISNSFDGEKYGRKAMPEVSIFDPALCEVIYSWFCPEGGRILDPFAGGSVRGIVANYLGYKYTGIDIRWEQIESNQWQAQKILAEDNQPEWICGDSDVVLDNFGTLMHDTPVEQRGNVFFKRDDFFNVNNANGGKARSCFHLIRKARDTGYDSVVTAGSRKSPQINLTAKLAQKYGLKCFAHCPQGELSDILIEARDVYGAVIVQHKAGYNSVIIKRARDDAEENNRFYVPFGMECDTAVEYTKGQMKSTYIDKKVKRIVISVGSGMTLAGILHGLKDYYNTTTASGLVIPVLGVCVGSDPEQRLDKYAPDNWREMVTLVKSDYDYHKEYPQPVYKGIDLDPIYEAKCIPYLRDGDLFWIIGNRYSTEQKRDKYDLIFSCPPYADLEVYSDMDGDISTLNYKDFIPAYSSIIDKSCRQLKSGGYACFVVGDVRDKKGNYFGFVSDTIKAFREAGLEFYNDMVLLQPLGTAMLRAKRQFEAGLKVVKVHENILLFRKY